MSQELGNKFRKIREAVNMSQQEFANVIGPGLSASYVSMIESGKRDPGPTLVELVRMKLGVSAVWWQTGEGEVIKKREEKTPPGSMEGVVLNLIGEEMDKLTTNGEKFDLAADLREFLRKRRSNT